MTPTTPFSTSNAGGSSAYQGATEQNRKRWYTVLLYIRTLVKSSTSQELDNSRIRHPAIADGAGIWQLVERDGTLDRNSAYMYLLLCQQFSDYCAVAEDNGELLGFVTGLRTCDKPDTWFLWQVGVSPQARGKGLAKRLLHFVLKSSASSGIAFLDTTVSPSNDASRALFDGLARRLNTQLQEHELFKVEHFPGDEHEAEPLLRIGPFSAEYVQSLD